jgi:hypothetical protein
MPRRSPAAKLVAAARAKVGVALAAAKVTVPMFEPFFWTSSTVSAVAAILAYPIEPVKAAAKSTGRARTISASSAPACSQIHVEAALTTFEMKAIYLFFRVARR